MVSLFAALLTGTSSRAVFVDNLLVAEFRSGQWRKAPEKKTMKNVSARTIGIGQVGATFTIQKVEPLEAVGGSFISEDARANSKVVVSGKRPSVPRKVVVSPAGKRENQILTDYLAQIGKTSYKPAITQVVKSDLDGDGNVETLIEAQTGFEDGPGSQMPKTACSLVFLYTEAHGKGKTFSVYQSFVESESTLPEHCRIRAIANLDSEKSIEIVASSNYYEGQSASVWRWNGKKLTKLAEFGAGV